MFERLAEGWAQATGGTVNLRAVDWIARSASAHNLTLDEATLLEAARRYAIPMRNTLAPMPDVVPTLVTLREQGYLIGMISNTIWPAELHLEDLAAVGVLPYLDHTIFSGEAGLWKPNRVVFEHALAAMGVRPAEAIFVGDNPREDIQGAQRAGMRAVWMHNTEFPLTESIHPDARIHALPELLSVLARWQPLPDA